MDLAQNWRPRFTEWVVRHGYLRTPLVVVDAGVQGGLHPRWDSLGTLLEAHGFDPLIEAIVELSDKKRPNRKYYCMALGAEDGECDIFIPQESTATSLFVPGLSSYAVSETTRRAVTRRTAAVRCLDSLMGDGTIPRVDYVKIDCEGAEPDILQGAQTALSSVQVIELETNFSVSARLPQSHFSAVTKQLLSQGFLLFDLAFNRIRYRSFVERARLLGIGRPVSRARPATCNALFCRITAPRTAEELTKRAIVLELYGMCDAAYEAMATHSAFLPPGPDWQWGADLLIRRPSLYALVRRVRASAIYRLRRAW